MGRQIWRVIVRLQQLCLEACKVSLMLSTQPSLDSQRAILPQCNIVGQCRACLMGNRLEQEPAVRARNITGLALAVMPPLPLRIGIIASEGLIQPALMAGEDMEASARILLGVTVTTQSAHKAKARMRTTEATIHLDIHRRHGVNLRQKLRREASM